MCEPMTMLAIAGVAGTAMSAYGQFQQGKAQKRAYNYNAAMKEYEATDVEDRGVKDANDHRQKVKALIGKQRAAVGGSGVLVDSGSNLDVQAETARLGELDALTIRHNATKAAWGLRSGATMGRAAGANAMAAGTTSAAATTLTGLGSTAFRYQTLKGKNAMRYVNPLAQKRFSTYGEL